MQFNYKLLVRPCWPKRMVVMIMIGTTFYNNCEYAREGPHVQKVKSEATTWWAVLIFSMLVAHELLNYPPYCCISPFHCCLHLSPAFQEPNALKASME